MILPLLIETCEPGPFVSGRPGKIHRSTSNTSLSRSSLPNPLTALEFESSSFCDEMREDTIKYDDGNTQLMWVNKNADEREKGEEQEMIVGCSQVEC